MSHLIEVHLFSTWDRQHRELDLYQSRASRLKYQRRHGALNSEKSNILVAVKGVDGGIQSWQRNYSFEVLFYEQTFRW